MSSDDAPVMTRFVLIRHGESVANSTGRVQGWRSCEGLTELGRDQCARLAERLQRTGELAGCHLYSSHLRRAKETAALLAPVLGSPDVAVDERFGEIDLGDGCDGLTWAEIVELHGTPDWDADPDVAVFPGAESLGELYERVSLGIEAIAREHRGGLVVICTHGGAIDAAMRFAMGIRHRSTFDFAMANTSLSGITDTSWGRWRIDRFNDAAHLVNA